MSAESRCVTGRLWVRDPYTEWQESTAETTDEGSIYDCGVAEDCTGGRPGPTGSATTIAPTAVRAEDLAMWQWVDDSEDDLAALSAWGDVAGPTSRRRSTRRLASSWPSDSSPAPRPMTVRDRT